MALINRSIPSLVNGVSQQAPSLRLPSQCEVMENCYPSLVVGLGKRPPTEHVAKLRATSAADAYVHEINRDAAERYVVILLNGDLEVYDAITGTAKTVAFPNGKTYLNAALPRTAFSVTTIADYTYITNTGTTVAMTADVAPGTLTGRVQNFSKLPASPTDGQIYEIVGESTNPFDNYYVKYIAAENVWRETLLPGITYKFNAATMPHVLVREADGTFTFKQATWDDLLIGDRSSAPLPSFVGKQVKDVFTHGNRFGMLSGENVVMTRAGDFFNFWPQTATAVLDSDPIDVPVSTNRVSLLRWAAPFSETVIFFSDGTQFALGYEDVLAPRTAAVNPTTEFESAAGAKPVASGQDLYFVQTRGSYSGVREYYVDNENLSRDAVDVTAHVPRYVPAGVYKLAVNTTEDALFCLSTNERNAIYVYKFYWRDDEKIQAAWFKWTFDAADTILSFASLGTELHLLISRSDGVYLEKIDLQPERKDTDMDFLVHVDRRVSLTGVYNADTDKTTWTLPFQESAELRVVMGSAFTGRKGNAITHTRPSNTTIEAVGDYSAGVCYIGRKYTATYEFSEQFIRDREGQPILAGRLQLRRMRLLFQDTGYFRVEVTPLRRSTRTYKFVGKTAGVYTIGAVPIESGEFQFTVAAQSSQVAIKIINDSHLPMFITSAEWEATYATHSQR